MQFLFNRLTSVSPVSPFFSCTNIYSQTINFMFQCFVTIMTFLCFMIILFFRLFHCFKKMMKLIVLVQKIAYLTQRRPLKILEFSYFYLQVNVFSKFKPQYQWHHLYQPSLYHCVGREFLLQSALDQIMQGESNNRANIL